MESGKVYSLLGANGATMVEISTEGLSLGSVVSYGDMANGRTEYVVIEEEASSGYGYKAINVETLSLHEVSVTAIEGPGGWEFSDSPEWNETEIADLIERSEAKSVSDDEKRSAESDAREERSARGVELLAKVKPEWAESAIIATLDVDDSDSMTDYFASHTTRRVFLGWSKHKRNLFSELRKAAATFGPTEHFGPKKDFWSAKVVLENDVPTAPFWKGSSSPWHRELTDVGGERVEFATEAELDAYLAEKGEPGEISVDGVLTTFTWKKNKDSVEHREDYSGGGGYYLGGRSRGGWKVRKDAYGSLDSLFGGPGEDLIGLAEDDRPAETEKKGKAVSIRPTSEAIEIEFRDEPTRRTITSLKHNGFYPHGGWVWKARRTPEVEAFVSTDPRGW